MSSVTSLSIWFGFIVNPELIIVCSLLMGFGSKFIPTNSAWADINDNGSQFPDGFPEKITFGEPYGPYHPDGIKRIMHASMEVHLDVQHNQTQAARMELKNLFEPTPIDGPRLHAPDPKGPNGSRRSDVPKPNSPIAMMAMNEMIHD
jgi:hypothetical protein